jgi:hypothetical protein
MQGGIAVAGFLDFKRRSQDGAGVPGPQAGNPAMAAAPIRASIVLRLNLPFITVPIFPLYQAWLPCSIKSARSHSKVLRL